MNRILLSIAAAGLLLSTPAFSQNTETKSPSTNAPAATTPAQQPLPQQPPQSRAGRTRSPQAGSVAGIGPNAAVSVAKAPGDGITGAGPAIITTGSGVGDRLTAEKAAPNQAAFLYSCAGADQIRTRDQSSVKNSYVFDWTHQLNQNTQLKLQVFNALDITETNVRTLRFGRGCVLSRGSRTFRMK